jgi:hypothetical protein
VKYALAVLLVVTIVPRVGSEIPNVKVENITIEERHTPHEEGAFISLLVRNDTETIIKVFELRVCYQTHDCEKRYLSGRFLPHTASWSKEEQESAERRILSVILTRVQTIEDPK